MNSRRSLPSNTCRPRPRNIAFIKGQAFSSDTAVRAKAVTQAANKSGIRVNEALVAQLEAKIRRRNWATWRRASCSMRASRSRRLSRSTIFQRLARSKRFPKRIYCVPQRRVCGGIRRCAVRGVPESRAHNGEAAPARYGRARREDAHASHQPGLQRAIPEINRGETGAGSPRQHRSAALKPGTVLATPPDVTVPRRAATLRARGEYAILPSLMARIQARAASRLVRKLFDLLARRRLTGTSHCGVRLHSEP